MDGMEEPLCISVDNWDAFHHTINCYTESRCHSFPDQDPENDGEM